MWHPRPLFVGFLWLPVLVLAARLSAQEASSDVVGYWEANASPGTMEPLAPLLLPAAEGAGRVAGVVDAGRITPQWFGQLPDPPETGAWWPRRGASLGTAFYGMPVAGLDDWTYASAFGGAPFVGTAVESLLRPGDSFAVIPFWTVEGLAGPASDASVFAAEERAEADAFLFPGGEVWAGRPAGGEARWVQGVESDPAGEDAGGGVLSAVNGLTGYRRSASAPDSRRLVFSGSARGAPLSVPIEPTPAGAVAPLWNPVFRPDGREFTLANTLGLMARKPNLGLIGGPNAEAADRFVIWSRESQQWEEFYYRTTAPAGWRTVDGRVINPRLVKVPAGAGFYVIRPSSLPRVVLKLPNIPASVAVTRSLFPQIIDRDRDRLADGWERANGSGDLSMQASDDGDGDGLTSLMESLLGGDPRVFDAPGRPTLEVRTTPGGVRELWVTAATRYGCRYRIEKRLPGASAWTPLVRVAVGTGSPLEIKDPVPLGAGDRLPRYYRVVGLTPADGDGDLLSDWEEQFVYGTDPARRDTDLDGVTDGAEIRSGVRDPFDYYDGRTVVLSVDPLSNGQVTGSDEWTRQAVAFRVRSNNRPLRDAPVTIAITSGSGLLALQPGDESGAGRVLAARADASGIVRFFVKSGAVPGRVEGSAAARVEERSGLVQLFTGNFVVHTSGNLMMPDAGRVRWFRPDAGVTLSPGTNRVSAWQPVGIGSPAVPVGTVVTGFPLWAMEGGRAWLRFTGKEKLDLGSVLPDDTFNAFLVASPTGSRTASAASISASGIDAGGKGQYYLLAAETEPGARVRIYDPPAKPESKVFSTWEQTNFRFHRNYLGGPAGEAYWQWTRPYDFPQATGRYDMTTGYRLTPAPAGVHRSPGTDALRDRFIASLGGHFANYHTSNERIRTEETSFLGEVIASERFYRVSATTWRGNEITGGFGGVARMDYSRVGTVGFALSSGAQTSGTYELAQYWKPSISGPASHFASGTGLPRGTVLTSVRVVNRIPTLDIGGQRRVSGSADNSKSRVLRGPRYLGGWQGSGNGFVGRVGDVLLYDRDLAEADRRAVEDSLAAAYRGIFLQDRDRDGLRDWWERAFFGNASQTSRGDLDGDLSSNLEEQTWGTDPSSADTDADGLTDKAERTAKTNPLTWDSDFDLLPDATDPLPRNPAGGRSDADGNGIPDGVDALLANRSLTDSDGDGLCDLVEAGWLGTNAAVADTDGDGVSDGDEVLAGTDPL